MDLELVPLVALEDVMESRKDQIKPVSKDMHNEAPSTMEEQAEQGARQ